MIVIIVPKYVFYVVIIILLCMSNAGESWEIHFLQTLLSVYLL